MARNRCTSQPLQRAKSSDGKELLAAGRARGVRAEGKGEAGRRSCAALSASGPAPLKAEARSIHRPLAASAFGGGS